MEPVVVKGEGFFLFHRESLAHRIDSYYCVRTSNGRIGCCPDGRVCYNSLEEGASNGKAEILTEGEVAGNKGKNVA